MERGANLAAWEAFGYVLEEEIVEGDDLGEAAVAVFEGGSEGEQDEDQNLLAALDAALDDIEEEEKADALKSAAAPLFDVSEVFLPSPEMTYRRHIDGFMGVRSRDLPRPAKRRKRKGVETELTDLLSSSLERARSSLEQRRAKVWVCSAGYSAAR